MKKLLSLALALIMVLSLAACGGKQEETPAGNGDAPAASTPAGTPSDTLMVVSSFDPGTFQPGASDEQSYNRIMRQIYEPLFFLNQEGEVEPWLATGLEWVDDVTAKISLRDDVKFSDGSPFTSADVIFTIEKAIEDALPIAVYSRIVNMEAPDEHTVLLTLNAPLGGLSAFLAHPMTAMGSKAAYEASGGDYLGGAVVGTGPYVLKDYIAGDKIVYGPNENYWRENEPKTPNVDYRIISSDTTRATEAMSLSTDIVINPNVRELPNIDNTKGLHSIQDLSANTTYMLYNTAHPMMSDVRVREAFSRAVNIPMTVKLVYGDFGEAASGMICPGILGYNPDTYAKYYAQDIAKAKQLLAEAGYPNGIELEVAVESVDTARCEMAEAMQAQCAEAGITLKVNKMESTLMREYMQNGQHMMGMYGWTCSTKEADGMLQQIQPGTAGIKRVNYDNQEFFDTFTAGCAIQDREERGKVWEECLEMLAEDYVLMPIWHKALAAAVKDNVDGFYLTTDYEEHYLQWAVAN